MARLVNKARRLNPYLENRKSGVVLLPVILSVAVATLFSSGCSSCSFRPGLKGRIRVPLRVCVIKGSSVSRVSGSPSQGVYEDFGNNNIDKFVRDAIAELNNKVWVPDANIEFYTPLYQNPRPGPTFDVPVILDPAPAVPMGSVMGDIEVGLGGIQLEKDEMVAAHQACLNAWSLEPPDAKEKTNSVQPGTIVIVARNLIARDSFEKAVNSQSNGVTLPNFLPVVNRNQADLCVVPRHLIAADVADQYVIVRDPEQLGKAGAPEFTRNLAHELGHTLLLGHGDGLQNGGTLPPNDGPRMFDQCGGTGSGDSLMLAKTGSFKLTQLQAELARDAAVLVRGHVGPL